MALQLANVALSDTFDTWRVRTNQIIAEAGSTSGTTPQTFAANTTFSANVTISGTLSGDAAAFIGAITAPTFTANSFVGGTISGTTGTYTGTVSAPTFTANSFVGGTISGTSGSFTGPVTAPIVTANSFVGGTISGTSGSFTGPVTAPIVTANSFVGPLTGTASAATTATTITLVATNSTDATHYPVFVDAATGNENPRTDTGLTYNPSTGTLTATDFNATSDATYKDQIAPIENALDIVNQLTGKAFNWKHTGKKSYGVIAQEVEKILPDVVTTNENGKSVNYNTLIALLIESNKQLNEKIKILEKKL